MTDESIFDLAYTPATASLNVYLSFNYDTLLFSVEVTYNFSSWYYHFTRYFSVDEKPALLAFVKRYGKFGEFGKPVHYDNHICKRLTHRVNYVIHS